MRLRSWLSRSQLWAAFGLLIFFSLQIPFLVTDLRYNGPEGVYWQVLRQLAAGRRLFSEVYCSQFPLFIYWARLGELFPMRDLTAARFLMGAFAPLALFSFHRLTARIAGERTAWIAVVLLAIDPFFFNLSHQFTGEIPGLALTLLAFELYLRAEERGRVPLVAALVFALAFQFKQVVFVPMLMFLVYRAMRLNILRKSARNVLTVIGVAFALNMVLLYAFDFFSGVGFLRVQNGHFANFVEMLFSVPHRLPVVENAIILTSTNDYSGAWLYLYVPLFALSCFLLRQRSWIREFAVAFAVLIIPLLMYVVINPDHLILFSVLVIVPIAALGAERQWAFPIAFVISSVFIVGSEFQWQLPKANAAQRRAIRALEIGTEPGDVVMGNVPFTITAAGRLTPPEFTDLSPSRFIAGDINCAVLEARFQKKDIAAFHLREKGMEHLDCDAQELVRRYFPVMIYTDDRQRIFSVR